MAASIDFQGRLTSDPEWRQTQNGQNQILQIRVAVDDQPGKQDSNTTYYSVSFWDRAGQTVAQYFHKGSPIIIHGKLTTHQYQTQQGETRLALNVSRADFEFPMSQPRGQQNAQTPQGHFNAPQGPQNNQQGNYRNQQQNAPQAPQMANNGYQQPQGNQQGQPQGNPAMPFQGQQGAPQGNFNGNRPVAQPGSITDVPF